MKLRNAICLCLLLYCIPASAYAGEGAAAAKIIKKIIKKCPACSQFVNSAFGKKQIENLVARGLINANNAETTAKMISSYGDDALKIVSNYGDDSIRIFRKYGDEGVTLLKKYRYEYIKLLNGPSGKSVNKILKHPKGLILLKENPKLGPHYERYGKSLLDFLTKNPGGLESVKLTGLRPGILSRLSQNNMTWLEATIPKMPLEDAHHFRTIIEKFGDAAVDFARRNQDILFKAGAFAVFAAHADEIIRGGRDVLIKMVEKGGESLKEVPEALGNATTETVKETAEIIGGTRFVIMVLGIVGLILVYRYMKQKKKE